MPYKVVRSSITLFKFNTVLNFFAIIKKVYYTKVK